MPILIRTLIYTWALALVLPVEAEERVTVLLSPIGMAIAPATLNVRATVTPHADNRVLKIAIDSPLYYRSSEIEIQGEAGRPTNTFEFRNLPVAVIS